MLRRWPGAPRRWRELEGVVGNPVIFWLYVATGYAVGTWICSLLLREPASWLFLAATAPGAATIMLLMVSRKSRQRRSDP